MGTTILVHGRHLDTAKWDYLVWGEPPHHMGSLPMLIYFLLHRGLDTIDTIVFGSGGSEKDGTIESVHTKEYLLAHLEHIDDFEPIKNHPNYTLFLPCLHRYLQKTILCDTSSHNTQQEIIFVATLAQSSEEVVQITSPSHAPRCLKLSASLAEQGIIPHYQIWSVIRDQIPYSGTKSSDVLIVEPPHRGDDAFCSEVLQPHSVFQRFYQIDNHADKVKVLEKIKNILP